MTACAGMPRPSLVAMTTSLSREEPTRLARSETSFSTPQREGAGLGGGAESPEGVVYSGR